MRHHRHINIQHRRLISSQQEAAIKAFHSGSQLSLQQRPSISPTFARFVRNPLLHFIQSNVRVFGDRDVPFGELNDRHRRVDIGWDVDEKSVESSELRRCEPGGAPR